MSVLCGPRAPTGAEATPFRAEATGERSIYIYIYMAIQVYNTLRTNNIVMKTEKSLLFGAAQRCQKTLSFDVDGGKR